MLAVRKDRDPRPLFGQPGGWSLECRDKGVRGGWFQCCSAVVSALCRLRQFAHDDLRMGDVLRVGLTHFAPFLADSRDTVGRRCHSRESGWPGPVEAVVPG